MIITTPTPGRQVWYRPSMMDKTHFGPDNMAVKGKDALAATVVAVHSDFCVNLSILDALGKSHFRGSVLLKQGEIEPVEGQGYCEWMPYQIKQAVKQAHEERMNVGMKVGKY